jgi:hypothetical protein
MTLDTDFFKVINKPSRFYISQARHHALLQSPECLRRSSIMTIETFTGGFRAMNKYRLDRSFPSLFGFLFIRNHCPSHVFAGLTAVNGGHPCEKKS